MTQADAPADAQIESGDGLPSALVVWRDGHLVPFSDATTHVLSHMAARGSQVFDVLLVVRTDDDLKAVGLRGHVARFLRSAEMMGMTDVGSVGPLESAVAQTVLVNDQVLASGAESADQAGAYTVKLVAAWEDEPDGLIPTTLKPTVYVLANPNRGHQPIEPWLPIRVKTATMPKVPASVLPPGLKVAASYTGGVREQIKARAEGFDQVVFKTVDGDLAESTTLSAFVVAGEKLLAPPLDTVLDGITRRLVLDAASSLGIPTEIRAISWREVESADELFLSSTNKPVVGISHLDHRELPSSNPVTSLLSATVIEILKDSHDLSGRWLSALKNKQ